MLEILSAGMGLVFLSMFATPKPTRDYRIRFWVGVVVLVGIALLGLRPLGLTGPDRMWVRYMSVFQCLFNLAVVAVLCLRYRLYMPRGNAT